MIRVILLISAMLFTLLSFGDRKGDSILYICDTATSKHKIIELNNAVNYFLRIAPMEAVELSNHALILVDRYPKDTLLTADVLRMCSSACFANNQLDKSMSYAIKALELQKQIGDSAGMIRSINVLAICYSSMGKFENALDFHQRALEISKRLSDSTYIATSYNNIANIYDILNQPKLSLEYAHKALEIRKHLARKDLLAVSYNNIGELFMEVNNLKKAKEYFLTALDLLDSNNFVQYKSIVLLNLADFYQKVGESKKSAKYYARAEHMAKITNDYAYLLVIYIHLSDIAKRNKKYKQALSYSNKAISIKDTLMKLNIHLELNRLRLQYDQKQTLLENQKLKNDNDKIQLKIDKEHLYINTLIIIVFLIITILFLLIKRFRVNNDKKLNSGLRKQIINNIKQTNEIKRLKRDIIENNVIISQLLNAFDSSVFVIDHENVVVYVNRFFNKEFDIDNSKCINTEVNVVFGDCELTVLIAKALSGIKKDVKRKLEISVFSKKIGERNVVLKRIEYSDKKFGVVGVIEGYATNDTKTQILSNENRFRNFANQLPEMIFEINLKGYITFANAKALNIFDITTQELALGLKIVDLVPEKTRYEISEKIEQIFANKPESTFGESELITKNGKVISVLIHIYALKVGDNVYGFRGILIDITQQKNKVEELRKAEERALNADKSKSLFLQNLSHEIRTPMNGIVGFSEILKNEELIKEERDAYIDIIINSSNQLLGIIDDIINISRIETGELKIEENEMSISDFFNNLMMFFHVYISSRKNNISIRLANKINPKFDKALIAEKQVRMIFNNLIGNAIKFTDTGFIEFGGRINEDNNFEFYVTDTGIGINPKYHKFIFDRFTQLNRNKKNIVGGTGLGLTISKALIEQMNGKIWVESDDGKGTTFYFTIPFKPAKENINTNTSVDKNIPDWSKYHFLIVEDDLNNFVYLEQILVKTMVKITHSTNGNEALKLLQEKNTFDLVLMDIQLPGINGLKIVEIIRKQGNKIPIIAQTANAMIEDKEESLGVGCDDYIAKPINKWVLLSKIETLFEKIGLNK